MRWFSLFAIALLFSGCAALTPTPPASSVTPAMTRATLAAQVETPVMSATMQQIEELRMQNKITAAQESAAEAIYQQWANAELAVKSAIGAGTDPSADQAQADQAAAQLVALLKTYSGK